MQNAVVINGLVKTFGKVTALNRVSASFSPGINIVLGPNGAGKSTLLKCISGLYPPDGGSVKVLGGNPYRDDALRRSMSLLSDNYALYDHLTVSENLLFFGRLYGLGDSEIAGKARPVLRRFDALGYLSSKVGTLSRGTKQKIAFCRSILHAPSVFLLDEPTAFLDPIASDAVREFLVDYVREGMTVVLVTQKIDEVTRLSGRLFVLNKGRLISQFGTDDLYTRTFRGMTISIRFARPISRGLAGQVPGMRFANASAPTLIKVYVGSYGDISEVLGFLIGRGAKVLGVDYAEPAIAEIFKRR